MTVTGPDGATLPWHTRRLLVRNGAAELRLHLALDAPPGRWTIRIRDAATGIVGETATEVAP